ncbi:MAG TPA: hypothetical protein VFC26_08220, partial [Verrucomicrobiae bacterium]|nr:hypothetical protein [Verrucomicrobiae bacterium]
RDPLTAVPLQTLRGKDKDRWNDVKRPLSQSGPTRLDGLTQKKIDLSWNHWERVYEAGAPVKQKSASFALGPQASQRSGR